MIIVISGSVGSGKTSSAKELSRLLKIELIHLNEFAKDYEEGFDEKMQTFDFNLDALLIDIEEKLKEYTKQGKSLILEGHFAHFINPDLVDVLFVISRDLKDLKQEYLSRGYLEDKISDNLEVEAFNLCFYEAEEEGYKEGQFFLLDNSLDLEYLVEKMIRKVKKFQDGKKF